MKYSDILSLEYNEQYNQYRWIKEQHDTLCSKLRGYYQYFGVRSNYKALEVVYEYAIKAWRRWLGRRHRDGYISC